MTSIYSFTDEQKPFDMGDLNELVYKLMENKQPLSTTNKYTIYIPSKGRPAKIKTIELLRGFNYKIVVEPQDYDNYKLIHPEDQLICLDKNDQGLAYVRNYIKIYSKKIGELFHWQLDDDIEQFKFRPRGVSKNEITSPLLALSIVEHCMDLFTNVAIGGISSDVFAFSKKYAVQRNRLAYQCILVNNLIDLEWDMGGTEDWHYTFTVLEHGYCTLAFHHIMTQTTPTMQNSGGSTDIHFAGNKRKILYQEFINRWPGRFVLKEYPDSPKRWRLQPIRKFFNDYKQFPILKHEILNN